MQPEPSKSSPETLLLIAGAGVYPLLMARGAREHGVGRVVAIGFRGQTSRRLKVEVDKIHWVRPGRLQDLLDKVAELEIRKISMAGQICPGWLFASFLDALARQELERLPVKNAHTIFSRLAAMLEQTGVEVLPATWYMGRHLTPEGVLTRVQPDRHAMADLEYGLQAALLLGRLDIGQTVTVKSGMVLSVEAFDGTNRTIKRGVRMGGAGTVVVKAAREGHDMRFDVPAAGCKTLSLLRHKRIKTLGLQAGRTLMLDREVMLRQAERAGIALVGLPSSLPPAPVLAK